MSEVDKIYPWFHVTGRFYVADRGLVYTVELDRDTDDFSHLIGETVLLSHPDYQVVGTVKGVERFMHAPPWRKGEPIGLLVEVITEMPRSE